MCKGPYFIIKSPLIKPNGLLVNNINHVNLITLLVSKFLRKNQR